MATPPAEEDYVLVQSNLLDRMRQHCENCPTYNIPLQHGDNGAVTTGLPRNSRKRKASQSLGSSQNASKNDTVPTKHSEVEIRLRQCWPSSENGLSQQSALETPRSGSSETSAQTKSSSPSPKKVKGVKKSRRDLAVDRFFQNAPRENRWRERQSELGLDTVEKYGHIIQGFLRHSHALSKRGFVKEPEASETELIVVGKQLAALTKSSLDNVGLQRSFAYFQVLILLSYCEFLRKRGISDQIINDLVRTIADIRERDRKALLDTIPWIHRLIVELVRNGWTLPRATELFFLAAISISDLVWIRSEGTFKSILDHFTADSFVKCSYDDCLTPSYSIPQLIASLFKLGDSGSQISLVEVYQTLGYNLSNLPHSLGGIYEVQNASNPASQRTPEFEVSTQESFVPALNNFDDDSEEPPQGEEQTADCHSPLCDTRSYSFQGDSFASTPFITPSQENHSTPPTTPSQSIGFTLPSENIEPTPSITEIRQSLILNHINHESAEQAAMEAEDLNHYSSWRDKIQLDQELSSRVQPRYRNDDVQGFFFGCSRLLHSPYPPPALLVSENLFRTAQRYFENSCRKMTFDEDGILLNQNGARLKNDLCNDFDSYCFTATMLVGRKLHVEFRHALSTATALVKPILQAQHPRTLACFLEVFIHLIQTGLPDVADYLRRFIKAMAAEVIRDGQPWGQICRLLGELDSEFLNEGMAQLWKCTADIFERELGKSSRLAMSLRLDYTKRVYGVTNKLEEERLLRDLLGRFGGFPSPSTPRVMLNLAHNLNRQGRHEEAENMARKVLSLLQEHEIYNHRIAERIECLKIVSHSQFHRRNIAAEQTMREAIRMIVEQWGIQHSWFFEFMNVLQSWLRDWGRQEDANELRKEIEVLRRNDVINE